MPQPNSNTPARTDQPKAVEPSKIKADFEGERPMFGAIKTGRDGLPPVNNFAIYGVQFCRFTSRPITIDHEEEKWLALGAPEAGCIYPASAKNIRSFLKDIRYHVVRWSGWSPEAKTPRFRKAEILDTRMGSGGFLDAAG